MLDRYRLLACLGAGGFGVVWSAHDELLNREVAVKRVGLSPEGDSERATREAQASARLSHPSIVALYEACAVEDAFYLISELINGRTLAQLIAARCLSDEQVLEIGVALAGALGHAHSRGVIHRDVKPQNVLIPDPGPDEVELGQASPTVAKLTDFGGASLVGEDVLTRTGDVMGTLAYMAPEQSEGREVREEADLYSLALVLYEALSGANPVRGATPAATARRIGRRHEPLERRRRDLPRALTRALDRALAPSPADRGTLDELAGALEQTLAEGLLGSRRGLGPRRGPRAGAFDPAPSFESAPAFEPVPPSERRPRPVTFPAERGYAHPGAPEAHAGMAPAGRDGTVAERPVAVPDRRSGRLPRQLWLAVALAAMVWQAWVGRPGLSLMILAAALPLAIFPMSGRSGARGLVWVLAALAPALGLLGLAGAFPAVAGQPGEWRRRAAVGALGYWWLTLAEPLAGRRLWLGAPSGIPPRGVWEGSISSAATHVVGPLLAAGVLLGALLWALGAVLLPWVVRGGSALMDGLAAILWSSVLFAGAPLLDGGLAGHAAASGPRGALLGAIVGALLAVAARALRGPV